MRGFATISSLLVLLAAFVGCQSHYMLPPNPHFDYSLKLADLPDAPPNIDGEFSTRDPATVENLNRKPRYMSLGEAIALALEQGTVGSQSVRNAGFSNDELGFFAGTSVGGTDSIRVFAMDPAIAGATIEGALGRFDAQWFGTMDWTTQDEPAQGFANFSNGMAARFQTGIAKPLPTGGVIGTSFTTNYNLLTNPPGGAFSVLNPTYTTRLQVGFEQPLLRNWGVQTNQLLNNFPGSTLFPVGGRQSMGTGIIIARLRYEQQKQEFERRVNYMLLNVEAAYWNLYSAYMNLYTNDMALRMSYEVWRITNEHHNVGKSLPEKLYGARGQYEQFRALRLQTVGQVLEAERTLRQLLGMPVEDGYQLIPVDAPTVNPYQADWKSALYDTMTQRPELELARMDVKQKELLILQQRNFLLPDLRFAATYTGVGLGSRLDGARTTVDGGFERVNNSLAVLSSGDFANWSMGVNWNTPLGYRTEHALMRQAKLQLAQSYVFLNEQERKATTALAKQYSRLAETYKQIEPRRLQRENYGKQVVDRLEIYAKFGDSKLPLDFLQSSVVQWANSLTVEYNAIVDYNIALAAFEFAKGTLMKYDNVMIADGPIPECAQVSAVDHERERSFALLLRERANPVQPEALCYEPGRRVMGLPRLPRRRAPGLPALMDGHSLQAPPPIEGMTPPTSLEPALIPTMPQRITAPTTSSSALTSEPVLIATPPTRSDVVLLPDSSPPSVTLGGISTDQPK